MPSSKPEAAICEVPSQTTYLGKALEPVAKGLRLAIACKVQLSGHEFVMIDDLVRHSGIIHQALSHLSSSLEDLMGNVIRNEGATMGEAYRAAGRLEQVLSEFVDGYHEVKSSHDGPEPSEARTLLLGVYRHHLREISAWLDELVQAIADPASALERRGLSPTDGAELSVVLHMTAPPQMTKLNELAKCLQFPQNCPIDEFPGDSPPAPPQPGMLGTLGALAFGFGISKAVFGGHRGQQVS